MKRRAMKRRPTTSEREPRPIDSMAEWLLAELSPLDDVELRRMFGGYGVYADDVFFGILGAGRIYLYTDAATREPFVAAGMGPFRPNAKQTLKNYYELPPELLDGGPELVNWCRRALAAARQRPTPRRRRGGRGT